MKVVILDRAQRDLIDAIKFYERQKDGLGDYFLQSLFDDVEALSEQAGIHEFELGFYRTLATVFPFAIYYMVEEQLVSVHAILDCRIDPKSTRERLK